MPLTRIITGDCRDVLKTLETESVHCVVTSPPYWGLRDYGNDQQVGLEVTPERYVAEMVGIFGEVRRVLRKDGTLWLNLGDSYSRMQKGNVPQTKYKECVPPAMHGRVKNAGLKPKDLVGIPWHVAFALQADGWYLRQDIIWSKPNALPESVTDRCTKAHEYIFLLTKSERYYYDADAIKERAGTRQELGFLRGTTDLGKDDGVAWHAPSILKRQAARKAGNKTHKYVTGSEENRTKGGLLKVAEKAYGMRNKRSVWTISSQSFKGAHFATFPPPLIQPCIKAGCPKGGVVLDPFGGSGTTGIVANSFGCDAILIELNPDYVKLAGERIKSAGRLFNRVQYS